MKERVEIELKEIALFKDRKEFLKSRTLKRLINEHLYFNVWEYKNFIEVEIYEKRCVKYGRI